MKSLKRILFASVLLLVGVVTEAKVVEIKSMTQILSSVSKSTLVVFDLDNTIMEPTQMLGSDQWAMDQIKRFSASGLKEYEAKNQGVARFAWVHQKTNVQAVEAVTPKLIQQLQKADVQMIGLTARPLTLTNRNVVELQSIGVNLALTAPSIKTSFSTPEPTAYYGGILVVGVHNNKGEILKKFLNAAQVKSTHIVFVDDKQSNADHVNEALNTQAIPHTEFRYSAADKKVAAFDPAVGDIQWDVYTKTGQIITDQQAKKMLGRR